MENKLVIAPSRRLAVRLRHDLNCLSAKTQGAWQTPLVYAIDEWFNLLWEQVEITGLVNTQLLSTTQSLLRWEYIILQSEAGKNLLQPYTTAKTAFEAWTILHEWQVIFLLNEDPENIDQGAFQGWANQYSEWLNENRYIDIAQLPGVILELLTGSDHTFIQHFLEKKTLTLYGFLELSPFLSHFLATLAAKGWQIEHEESIKKIPKKIVRKAYPRSMQEIKAAALWAKSLHDEGKSNIAIVVPNLPDLRKPIDSALREAFQPLQEVDPEWKVCPFFNFSAGYPLVKYPIIMDAFEFLRCGFSRWSLSHFMNALHSPFAKAEEDVFSRVQFGKKLQEPAFLSLDTAILAMENLLPTWREILGSARNHLLKTPKNQRFNAWAKTFKSLLTIFGWPGARTLNSIEYQCVKKWEALLNELAYSDDVLPIANYHEAFGILYKLASNTPFQPENKGAPIQILGILEAIGQQFDYLWVMSFDSEGWPQNISPNPFISPKMQRQYQMPHASVQRELQFAQKVMSELKNSANTVIFSHSLQEGEKRLAPSFFIRDVPFEVPSVPLEGGLHRYFASCPTKLGSFVDDQAPPCEHVRGTVKMLSLQAACPFKAFAELRLNATASIKSEMWLQPYEKGILLHAILEEFWKSCKNSLHLAQMTTLDLENILKQLIDKHMKISAPSHYVDAEKTRLKIILLDYLNLEKKRPPFEIVALEKKLDFELADVTFNLRLDRIDQTPEGDMIVIDYKTGLFKLSSLFDERSLSPQLALYYLAMFEGPQALMVAKLEMNSCQFEGVSETEMGIEGVLPLDRLKGEHIPKEWGKLRTFWTSSLSKLVYEFKRGEAKVQPQGQVCFFCHLKPLCRIQEQERIRSDE